MTEKRRAPESIYCVSCFHDWAWPQLPNQIFWRCDAWPDLGECTPDRRPCTSPRRNQCRSGGWLRSALGVVWTEYQGQQECCEEMPW